MGKLLDLDLLRLPLVYLTNPILSLLMSKCNDNYYFVFVISTPFTVSTVPLPSGSHCAYATSCCTSDNFQDSSEFWIN